MAQGLRYKPFQYQEAYIPFEEIPMVDQTLGYHQNRYDQTNQALAGMYQDLYNRQVYDPEAFDTEVGAIKQRVEDIDKKYNKDLSAGMSDYINLIGRAKQSPFWKLNDAAIEKQKQYDAINAQLRVAGQTPLEFKKLNKSLRYTDPSTGQMRYITPDELNYDVQGQLKYADKVNDLWKDNLHETSIKGRLPKSLNSNSPFIEIGRQRGVDKSQVLADAHSVYNQYRETNEYKQQKRKLTELEGMSNEQADKFIQNEILDSGLAKTWNIDDSQILRNPDYLTALQRRRLAEESKVQPMTVFGAPRGSTAFQTGFSGKDISEGINKDNPYQSVFDKSGKVFFVDNSKNKEDIAKNLLSRKSVLGITDSNSDEANKSAENIISTNKKYNDIASYVKGVVNKAKESYPEDSKGKTDKQILDMVLNNKDKYSISMSNEYPIYSKSLTTRRAFDLAGSIDNAEIFMRNNDGSVTNNWQGKNGIAENLSTNSAGLGAYVKANKDLIFWDDGEMAYGIIVPKNIKKISSSGNYDLKDYDGEYTKIYWNTSEADKHIRNVVKSLERTVKGDYRNQGLSIRTNAGNTPINIVLPKGVPVESTEDKVFEIRDLSGNPVLNSKLSYNDIKSQYIQSKMNSDLVEHNNSKIEGKKYKQSELTNLELEE